MSYARMCLHTHVSSKEALFLANLYAHCVRPNASFNSILNKKNELCSKKNIGNTERIHGDYLLSLVLNVCSLDHLRVLKILSARLFEITRKTQKQSSEII